jgi:hypothetical protein
VDTGEADSLCDRDCSADIYEVAETGVDVGNDRYCNRACDLTSGIKHLSLGDVA